jgi:hypothetical protein
VSSRPAADGDALAVGAAQLEPVPGTVSRDDLRSPVAEAESGERLAQRLGIGLDAHEGDELDGRDIAEARLSGRAPVDEEGHVEPSGVGTGEPPLQQVAGGRAPRQVPYISRVVPALARSGDRRVDVVGVHGVGLRARPLERVDPERRRRALVRAGRIRADELDVLRPPLAADRQGDERVGGAGGVRSSRSRRYSGALGEPRDERVEVGSGDDDVIQQSWDAHGESPPQTADTAPSDRHTP